MPRGEDLDLDSDGVSARSVRERGRRAEDANDRGTNGRQVLPDCRSGSVCAAPEHFHQGSADREAVADLGGRAVLSGGCQLDGGADARAWGERSIDSGVCCRRGSGWAVGGDDPRERERSDSGALAAWAGQVGGVHVGCGAAVGEGVAELGELQGILGGARALDDEAGRLDRYACDDRRPGRQDPGGDRSAR